MNNLSPKKQKFLDFITGFISANDRSPTFTEIMKGLKLRSLGTVNWYVRELEAAGFIVREKANGKRALRLSNDNPQSELPLLGVIAAGYPLEAVENPEMIEVPPSFSRPGNYVLRVKGDSMINDHIIDGDYVIVTNTMTAGNGDIIVAIINEEATLKRFFPENSPYTQTFYPKPDTTKWETLGGIVTVPPRASTLVYAVSVKAVPENNDACLFDNVRVCRLK